MKGALIWLMSAIIFLQLATLATWFWFMADMHLLFDSQIFNNIATPLVSIGIFFIALYFPWEQNRIARSQYLKTNFISRTKGIKKYLKRKVEFQIDADTEKFNGLNYINLIGQTFLALTNDKEYSLDFRAYKKGEGFDLDSFQYKSYFKRISFLSFLMSDHFGTYVRYDEIFNLLEEIEASRMLETDKVEIKKYIKTELVGDYVAYLTGLNTLDSFLHTPALYEADHDPEKPIKFLQLNKTSFAKYFERFNGL